MTMSAKIAALSIPVALMLTCSVAHADPGGQIPAPGLCEYPGIGGSGMIMSSYYYWCDFPTELNGSHHHCELGGFAIQANGNVGVNIMMFSAGVGISGNIGGITGSCTWRCPDNTLAQAPNPPGGWKDGIIPTKCKTIGPNPDEVPAPVSAPIAEQGAVPAVPFGDPPPAVPAAGAPPAGLFPSVTDPVCPNPDAPTNEGCGGTGRR
jgi:hypothetical protein